MASHGRTHLLSQDLPTLGARGLLCLLATAAQAQQAAPEPPAGAVPVDRTVQSVVVVGVRASLISAQALKRERLDIVDSVVADDIGKLPDVSVTEALQRVTGVQIARDRGEGTGVVIRGLTQIETTLDGREVFTAGAGRAIDFSTVAAELVAGIDVYKSSSASRIEGGVGGQIDLRTRRPFDFAGSSVAGSMRAVHGDLVGRTRMQYSGLASQRWGLGGGGEIGALIALSRQVRPWREDLKGTGNPAPRTDLVPGTTVVAPSSTSETTSLGERERKAVQAVLQWRVWQGLDLYTEASFVQLHTAQDSYQINAGASTTFEAGSVALFPGTNDLRHITWTNSPVSVLSFARDTVDRTRQVAAGGRWEHDRLSIKADVSRTTSFDNLFFSGPFFAGTAARFTQDLSSSVPSTSLGGTDLLDPATFHYTGVAYRARPFDGSLTAAQLDGELALDAGWIRSLSAGLRVARREADDARGLIFADAPVTGVSVADKPGYVLPTPITDFLAGTGATSIANYLIGNLAQARDPVALRAAFGIDAPIPTAGAPLGLWRIAETTQSTYGMATIAALDDRLDGNAGLRVVRTREAVGGNQTVPGTGTVAPLNLQTTRVDYLPSLNLRYALGGGQYVRAAASRTLTRQNFDQLSPSLTLVPNPINPSLNQGGAGNPALRPIRADSVDLAFETYADRSTSASVTAFYKHVDGFVTPVSKPETYGGVTYQVTRPQNSNAADIKGLEVGYQQFYTGLPGPWGGLGLQANATWVDSQTPGGVLGGKVPLANLSKYSANVIGMYERGPVSVRIAYNWRDRFLSGVVNVVGVGALPVYTRAYGWLDASVVYRFTDHVSLTLAGGNLLNTARRSYFGVTTRPQSATVNDVQVSAALSLRL
ncbi:MAG: TonB-dependent receptor [Betaproteobacteria bacterium]